MTDEGHAERRELAPPAPEALGTEPEFVRALQALKAWSGLSFREIEAKARASGLRLPFSTAAGMLRRSALPREDLLIAFTTACGLDDDEVTAWVAARKKIAVARATGVRPGRGDRGPAAGAERTSPASAPVCACHSPQAPRRTSRWRRVTVAVSAVVVTALTAGPIATQGRLGHDVEVNHATAHDAPPHR